MHIIAISSSAPGVLNITSGPSNNEQSFEMDFLDNRTGIVLGETTKDTGGTNLLVCEVVASGTSPTVVWTRNGIEVDKDSTHDPTSVPTSSGLTSTLEIQSFALSDVGEYQCIVTDDDTDAEIIMSRPFRLDTGKPKPFMVAIYSVQNNFKCVFVVL